jgi:hypothetical protein
MRTAICLASLMSVVLGASHAQANLLVDGSFEAATGDGTTSNSPWVLTANQPNGSFSTQFQTSSFAASDGNTGVWYKSFTGLFDGGLLTADSMLVQSLVAPQNGTYILTFDAAREEHFLADEWYVTLEVDGLMGSAQDTVDLLAAPMPDGNFNSASTQFELSLDNVLAGETVNVLAVMAGGRFAPMNPQSAVLDNFSLVVIPEVVPEPASMILLGLCVVGSIAARRSQQLRVSPSPR